MKNRFYVLALTLGLAPGIALAQSASPNYPYPSDRQHTDQDRNDQQQRMDRDDQQRGDQDYDRGTRRDAGNLDRMLRDRYPNSNIAVNYQDNNTVVLTGNAATGHDRKDAEDFVRSQLGNMRVIDQIQVNGYGRGGYPNGAYNPNYPNGDRDRDRNSGYNQQYPDRDRDRDSGYSQQTDRDRDRGQNVDRDQDRRVPQSDVDANRTDRDRDEVKDRDRDHTRNNDKDKDRKHQKDKNKNKDKDRNQKPDSDEQPH